MCVCIARTKDPPPPPLPLSLERTGQVDAPDAAVGAGAGPLHDQGQHMEGLVLGEVGEEHGGDEAHACNEGRDG